MSIQAHVSKTSEKEGPKPFPRLGVCFSLMGYQLDFRYVSLFETLSGLPLEKWTLKNIASRSLEQFEQIQLGQVPESCSSCIEEIPTKTEE